LSGLSWDQILNARALLADPPPAKPLGPRALAEMARGESAPAAAAREVARGLAGAEPEPASAPPTPPARPARRQAGRKRPPAASVRIRKARDRVAKAPAAPPLLPLLDELFQAEGRAVIEGLIRRRGALTRPIVRALAGGWRRADGEEVGEGDLRALLDVHGLARAYARREREAALHALRAAAGSLSGAANALEMTAPELAALLDRTGATAQAESIRSARRKEIRLRGTLTERVQLLLRQPEALADLGLLEEFEADLRARLPEHLRALRAGGGADLALALGRSLSLERSAALALLGRLGLDLSSVPVRQPGAPGAPSRPAPAPARRPSTSEPVRRPRSPRMAASSAPGDRPRGKPPARGPRPGRRPARGL
jgi:hypothetical protein